MRLSAFLLFLSIWLVHSIRLTRTAEHRYKYRGPPLPPRPPSPPPYVKKWQHHMPPPAPHQLTQQHILGQSSQRYHQRRPPQFLPSAAGHHMGLGFPPGKFGAMSLGQLKGGGFGHPGGLTLQQQYNMHQMQQLQKGPQYLPLQHKGLPPITKGLSSVPRPVIAPQPQLSPTKSNLWNYKTHQLPTKHKDKLPAQFLSSPQTNTLEYDYHIQTNNIPNPAPQTSPVIKHYADNDSGPIHTIPAPNLSLADKPKNLDLELQQPLKISNHQYNLKPSALGVKYTHVEIQKSHQYQVTESPHEQHQPQLQLQQQSQQYDQTQQYEPSQQYAGQTQLQEQYGQSQLQQQSQLQPQVLHQEHNYGELEAGLKQVDQLQFQHLESLPQAQFLVQPQPQEQQQLPNQQILGVFNGMSQQQLIDLYTIPLSQPQVIQPSFTSQTVLPTYQHAVGSVQPEYLAADQYAQSMKQPEYHSFNYQELEHQRNIAQDSNRNANEQQQHQHQHQQEIVFHHSNLSPNHLNHYNGDQLQSQHGLDGQNKQVPYDVEFVQQFFEGQDGGRSNSAVESSGEEEYSQSKSDAIVNAFYSTLPNKEAAEALASLQQAGKLNSGGNVNSKGQDIPFKAPMTIYVPDDFEDPEEKRGRNNSNTSKKTTRNSEQSYDSSSNQEDDVKDVTMSENDSPEFGERIKPKTL